MREEREALHSDSEGRYSSVLLDHLIPFAKAHGPWS